MAAIFASIVLSWMTLNVEVEIDGGSRYTVGNAFKLRFVNTPYPVEDATMAPLGFQNLISFLNCLDPISFSTGCTRAESPK